jgi:hypothetical protein
MYTIPLLFTSYKQIYTLLLYYTMKCTAEFCKNFGGKQLKTVLKSI